ncbi:MAG: hypothetical protein ACK4UP_07265 [Spirosomataceae bacterium]
MTLSDVHVPSKLTPAALDKYLASGWFRMGQAVFTTNFLLFDKQFYSAIWIRTELQNWTPSTSQNQLIKKVLRDFHVKIKPFSYRPVYDKLFDTYKASLSFTHSNSIDQLLFGGETEVSIFDTYTIEVYDKKRLIGLGFFDVGAKSMAGVSCIFDPSYRKYSLGKFMMLQKMLWGKKKELTFFYPGYIAPGYPTFEYKTTLAPETTQCLRVQSKRWVKLENFDLQTLPIHILTEKIELLQQKLAQAGIPSQILKYSYHDSNTVPHLRKFRLVDTPLFIAIYKVSSMIFPMIQYDFVENVFVLKRANKMYRVPHNEIPTEGFYDDYLLQANFILFKTDDLDEMVEFASNKTNMYRFMLENKSLT